MKYLIFKGSNHYPEGGFLDVLKTDADPQSLEDCKLAILDALAGDILDSDWDWIHVVDLDIGNIVKKFQLSHVEDKVGLLSYPW